MWKYLLDLFFPKICPSCHSILEDVEVVFCTQCRHEMPLTQHHLNPRNEAFQKFYGKIDVVHASAFLRFSKKGMVQEIIHQLKYKNQEAIGQVLAEWYAEDLKLIQPEIPFDVIIPVPLHPKKEKLRGYNQVEKFGKTLAQHLNVAYDDTILYRKTYSKTLSKKNRDSRAATIQNAFEVIISDKNTNKHFVLVDDVLTTGATLEACSRALLQIPGAKISVICMAMAQ